MNKHYLSLILRYALPATLCLAFLLSPARPVRGLGPGSVLPDLDIVLVIDESGSMWDASDPPDRDAQHPGWRIVMADMFADLLGVDHSDSRHRLAVITFGTKVTRVRGFTEMGTPSARDALKAALDSAHTNMGWTNLPEALKTARDVLDADKPRGEGQTKRVVVFLSDGHYELHKDMTEAEIAEGERQIRQYVEDSFRGKYPIYSIAFTKAASQGRDPSKPGLYKNILEEMALRTGGKYYEAATADRDLLYVYTGIIRELLGQEDVAIDDPKPLPVERSFDIPGNLLQVMFTIIKSHKSVETAVIGPDGRPVVANDTVKISTSPQTISYGLSRPAAGKWTVTASGAGKATILDPIMIRLDMLKVERQAPGSTHPAGKPMDIVVTVVDKERKPQKSADFQLDVTLPDGKVLSLKPQPDGDNYRARIDDTGQIGYYKLSYGGHVGQAEIEAVEDQIKVIDAFWLALIEPQAGKVYPLNAVPIAAQLMHGKDEKITSLDPKDDLSRSQVSLLDGERTVDIKMLGMGSGGLLGATLQGKAEGTYMVRAVLIMKTALGEAFDDITEMTVRLGPVQKATDTPVKVITPPTISPTAVVGALSIDWQAPGKTLATGKPLEVALRVIDAAKKPQVMKDLRLEVKLPNGNTEALVAELDSKTTTYRARWDDTKQKGTYVVHVVAQPETGERVTAERTVEAKTPVSPLLPILFGVGGLGVLGLAGVGGGVLWWLSQRAVLEGTIDVAGNLYPLGGTGAVRIGSDPACRIPLPGQGVLPRHAELRPTGSKKSSQVEIRALDVTNPVKVNGIETSFQILQNGDKIEIGDQSFTYSGPPRFDLTGDPLSPGGTGGDLGGGTSSSGSDTGDWNF